MMNKKLYASMAFFILGACAHVPEYKHEIGTVLTEAQLQHLQKINDIYPKEMKAVHRVLLKVYKREYDFTGYFLLKQPNTFHASAFVEAGAAIFEFQRNADGTIKVLKKPRMLMKGSIRDGIAKDLLNVYGQKNFSNSTFLKEEGNRSTYLIRRSPDFYHEYLLQDSGHLLFSQAAKGHLVKRRIWYKNFKTFENWPHQVPTEIKIVNYQYEYSMDVQLIKLEPSLPTSFDKIIKDKS